MSDTMHDAKTEGGRAATAVGSSAKAKAGEVGATAEKEARALAHDASYEAKRMVGETREQLRSQATQQTSRLAGTLRDVGSQLHEMASADGAGDGMVANATEQLAGTTTRLAERLDGGGFENAVEDVKRFARRRPGLFVLGAVGAGFAVGRLLKATDTHALVEHAKRDRSPRRLSRTCASRRRNPRPMSRTRPRAPLPRPPTRR
jgi:vacuolar-type H+-ATPase subunit H